jgi:hypothetical protein
MALLVLPAALCYYAATVVVVCALLCVYRSVAFRDNHALPAITAGFSLGNRFVFKVAAEMIGCAVYGASRDGCEDASGVYFNPMD